MGYLDYKISNKVASSDFIVVYEYRCRCRDSSLPFSVCASLNHIMSMSVNVHHGIIYAVARLVW